MGIFVGDEDLEDRLDKLEDKYETKELFETISGTTTGTVTTYANISISQDDWAGEDNAIAVETSAGRPTQKFLFTAAGELVEAIIDVSGNYTLSGTPTASNYAICWIVTGQQRAFANANIPESKIITEYDIESPYVKNGTTIMPIIAGDDLYQGSGYIKTANKFIDSNLTNERLLRSNSSGEFIESSSDILDSELETLSDGSDASSLHTHASLYPALVNPSTDNAIVRFDGTTGQQQDSGITIDDDDNLIIPKTIQYNTSYTPTGSEPAGTTYWDDENKTFTDVLENGVKGQRYEESFITGQNDTGDTLVNGTVATYAGSIGISGHIRVANTLASAGEEPILTIGIVTADIADGSRGKITTEGNVRGIQTDGANYSETWIAGNILYKSDTVAGGLTNVMPEAPIPAIPLAVVIAAHASNGTLMVRPTFPSSLLNLTDVNGTPVDTTGQIVVWDEDRQVFDFNYNYLDEPTLEYTGFKNPENVIVTGDSTTRTVTLTGSDWNAYYRKRLDETIISGWTSPAHDNTTSTVWFLTYDGTDIDWRDVSTLDATFYNQLLIAIAFYNSSDANWVYQRECHGFQPWLSHRGDHQTIGTYRQSGGTLGDYTLSSTTAADRRPSVSSALLYDEDLPTTQNALPVNTYSQFYLSGAGGSANFITSQADIVPLSGNRPYYNQFTGGSWQQTLISNNDYMNIYLLAIPMAEDTNSQDLRYLFVQGQNEYATLIGARGETVNDISLGVFNELTPESIFIQKITILYQGGNWEFVEVVDITGTKVSQAQSPAGNYLSSVTTDATLTGLGTSGSPLGIDLSNANTWTGKQTFSELDASGNVTLNSAASDLVFIVFKDKDGNDGYNYDPGTYTHSFNGSVGVDSFGATSVDITTTLTLAAFTTERLLKTNASGVVQQLDLVDWISGTTDQIIVTDDTDGSVTLSTPQDIATTSNVTFGSVTTQDVKAPAISSLRLSDDGEDSYIDITNASNINIVTPTEMTITGAFVANEGAGDFDFTINKQTTGVAYKYDAGLDSHDFGGMVTLADSLVVQGDFTVNGDFIVQNVEELTVKDPIITLNSGETDSGVTYGRAGIEIDRGSADPYAFWFDEIQDNFRIGEFTKEADTAQAGAATTITLASGASAVDDFYNALKIKITGGTGAGQIREITDYVGSTKVATVATWTTNPDSTSTYEIIVTDSTVAVAGRENLPTDDGIAFFNTSTLIFETSPDLTFDGTNLFSTNVLLAPGMTGSGDLTFTPTSDFLIQNNSGSQDVFISTGAADNSASFYLTNNFAAPTDSSAASLALRVKHGINEGQLAIGSEADYHIVFTTIDNIGKNHDHASKGRPVFYGQSETSPDTDNAQWYSLEHDTNDFVLATGKGGYIFTAEGSIIAQAVENGKWGFGITTPLSRHHLYSFSQTDATTAQNTDLIVLGAADVIAGSIVSNFNNSSGYNIIGYQVDSIAQNGLNFPAVAFSASRIAGQGDVIGLLLDDLQIDNSATSRDASGVYINDIKVDGTNTSSVVRGIYINNIENTNTPENAWSIYIAGDTPMYSRGNIGINETAPETALQISDTNPYITTKNSGQEDTNYGRESRWISKGYQSGGELTTLGYASFNHQGTLDDETGRFEVRLNNGNDGDTPTTQLDIGGNGSVTWYSPATNTQFNINSDNGEYASLILQDAGSDLWKIEKTNGNDFTITESGVSERIKIFDGTGTAKFTFDLTLDGFLTTYGLKSLDNNVYFEKTAAGILYVDLGTTNGGSNWGSVITFNDEGVVDADIRSICNGQLVFRAGSTPDEIFRISSTQMTIATGKTITGDSFDINGGTIDAVTLGTNSPVTEAQIDNININGNTITSTGAMAITTTSNGAMGLTANEGNIDLLSNNIEMQPHNSNSISFVEFKNAAGTSFATMDALNLAIRADKYRQLNATDTLYHNASSVQIASLSTTGDWSISGDLNMESATIANMETIQAVDSTGLIFKNSSGVQRMVVGNESLIVGNTTEAGDQNIIKIVQEDNASIGILVGYSNDSTNNAYIYNSENGVLGLYANATLGLTVETTGNLTVAQNFNMASGKTANIENIQAVDSTGLSLKDDSGNLGIHIEDGGEVGIGTTTPGGLLEIYSTSGTPSLQLNRAVTSTDDNLIWFKEAGANRWFTGQNDGSEDLLWYSYGVGDYVLTMDYSAGDVTVVGANKLVLDTTRIYEDEMFNTKSTVSSYSTGATITVSHRNMFVQGNNGNRTVYEITAGQFNGQRVTFFGYQDSPFYLVISGSGSSTIRMSASGAKTLDIGESITFCWSTLVSRWCEVSRT